MVWKYVIWKVSKVINDRDSVHLVADRVFSVGIV